MGISGRSARWFAPRLRRGGAGALLASAFAMALASAPGLMAQESEVLSLTEETHPYRAALHHDPLLDSQLEHLVRLYERAGRVDELIGLYRSHIERYPDDAVTKAVLVRILKKVDHPGEGELLASATLLHPGFAPLQYLLYLFLDEKGDPRAVDALSTAIELETNQAKKSEWLEELLKLSEDERAREMAEQHLTRILELENQTGSQWLAHARLMERYRFRELGLRAVAKASAAGLRSEEGVEAEILAARMEFELEQRDLAGRRLDQLLARLAPDHWQRREIMSLRMGVVATEEEREATLGSLRRAYEERPESETAALDYAEALLAGERRREAAQVLSASAGALPASVLLESRAIEILESINDSDVFERFLAERLELDPERADLRFRLVKIYFSLRRDAEAEQEFRVVLAGLDLQEVTAKLLELQRYLRGIERPAAALSLLEHHVRNHPASLAVARELADVYAASGRGDELPRIVGMLDPEGVSAGDVVDFARFLISRELAVAARRLLEAKLESLESPDFTLTLLMIEVLGIVGDAAEADRFIARGREQVDSPERYRSWVEASASATRRLESLDRFLESEERRYSFDDGEWNPLRIEQFLILCEVARDRLQRDRVLSAVRSQLAAANVDASLKLRLRRFLVGLLVDDPGAFEEVDEHLKQLAVEDAGKRLEYDLQRALVYHRARRPDLAKTLLVGTDFSRISTVSLAHESVEVLIEFGFLTEAASALAAVNRLSPEDVFSWERRLTLLAVLAEETAFRSIVRQLRSEEAPLRLGPDSLAGLDRHLVASYWRSVSRRIASGDAKQFEEVLPLLATVDRESVGIQAGAWTEWTRAVVLQSLGRENEATEARERLTGLIGAGGESSIAFPDGLSLSLAGAELFLNRALVSVRDEAPGSAEFLLPQPEMRWAFELEPGNRIDRIARTEAQILVMDRRRQVHALDSQSGKLLWKRSFSQGGDRSSTRAPIQWPGAGRTSSAVAAGTESIKLVPSFAAQGDRFFILHEGRLEARRAEDGSLLWAEPLPFEPADDAEVSSQGARPGILLKVEGEHAVAFQPASGDAAGFESSGGKLLWHRRIGDVSGAGPETGESAAEALLQSRGRGSPEVASRLYSLNSGLDLDRGLVFVYGWETAVLDAATGRILWDFTGGGGVTFPVVLRRDRSVAEAVDSAGVGAVAVRARADESTSAEAPGAEVPGEEPDPDSVPAELASANGSASRGGRIETGVSLIDYLKGPPRRGTRPPLFRDGRGESAAMLSSGAYWARARLRSGGAAMGVLDGGYLWLMQDGRVRRVSARFPVAARELPAQGTYLGRSGQHLWFLEGATLHHLDFLHDRVSAVDVSAVGGERVKAHLEGNQILVSGRDGLRVINAITGRIVGSGEWPRNFVDYLEWSRNGEAVDPSPEPAISLWQGQVLPLSVGGPRYCLPLADAIRGEHYVERFGERVLVSFGPPRGVAP